MHLKNLLTYAIALNLIYITNAFSKDFSIDGLSLGMDEKEIVNLINKDNTGNRPPLSRGGKTTIMFKKNNNRGKYQIIYNEGDKKSQTIHKYIRIKPYLNFSDTVEALKKKFGEPTVTEQVVSSKYVLCWGNACKNKDKKFNARSFNLYLSADKVSARHISMEDKNRILGVLKTNETDEILQIIIHRTRSEPSVKSVTYNLFHLTPLLDYINALNKK